MIIDDGDDYNNGNYPDMEQWDDNGHKTDRKDEAGGVQKNNEYSNKNNADTKRSEIREQIRTLFVNESFRTELKNVVDE